jgi:hypothetical protein
MTRNDEGSRSLTRRLGLKDPRDARVFGRPTGFDALEDVPDDDGSAATAAGFILAFVSDAAQIAGLAPRLTALYRPGGHLWLAYPKRSGPIRTDISRDAGWEPLLGSGFLPVSQVAVDATWSALRFRRREEIRKLTRKRDVPGR